MVAILTLIGGLMALSAGGAYYTMPRIIEMVLPSFINLDKNGLVYPMFMAPPFFLRSRYMIFDITNKNQVVNGAKPKLGLRGPIFFKTSIYRDNISWHNDGKSLAFDSHRKLVLDEENSQDLDTKVWIFNPIVVGVADQVRSIVIDRVPFKRLVEPIVFNSVNLFLDRFSERAIVKRSPREFLEGTKIDILDFLMALANQFGLGALVPPGPPNNIFGIAYVQNETVDGSEIWTGIGDSRPYFAELISWHGNKVLPYWKGECNKIKGTNGELYKPLLKIGKPIRIFLGPTCRSLWLDPVGGSEIMPNGILAYEYTLSKRNFQAPPNNAANECYCPDTSAMECRYDGLIRLGPCFFDAPVLFARPNMTGADRRLRSTIADEIVNGTKMPLRQSFWLEPTTSVPIKVDMTFMAVLKIIKQNYMRDMDKLQPLTYYPMFASQEYLVIPDNLAWQLKMLQKMYLDNKFMCMVGVAAGLITALFGMMLPRKQVTRRGKRATKEGDRNSKQQREPRIATVHPDRGFLDEELGSHYDEDYGSRKPSARSAINDGHLRANGSITDDVDPRYRHEEIGGQLKASSARRFDDNYVRDPAANLPRSARLYPGDYSTGSAREAHSDRDSARTISTKVASSDDSGTERNNSFRAKSHSSRRSSARRRVSTDIDSIEEGVTRREPSAAPSHQRSSGRHRQQ